MSIGYEELKQMLRDLRWIDDIPEDQDRRDEICLQGKAALLLEANIDSAMFPNFIRSCKRDQMPPNNYLEDARIEIVDLDGANLVVLNPGKKCYLIYRCASKEVLRQIWELLKQVSISMYMKVPLQKDERIAGEEQFLPDKNEKKLLKRSLHPD